MIQKIRYKIKGNSRYFLHKYGISNPVIEIEGEDREVFGKSWREQMEEGNPACISYCVRSYLEMHPGNGKVYYGHIISNNYESSFGELVHEKELVNVK